MVGLSASSSSKGTYVFIRIPAPTYPISCPFPASSYAYLPHFLLLLALSCPISFPVSFPFLSYFLPHPHKHMKTRKKNCCSLSYTPTDSTLSVLTIHLCIFLFSPFTYLSICLSIYPFIHLSHHPSIPSSSSFLVPRRLWGSRSIRKHQVSRPFLNQRNNRKPLAIQFF